MMVLDEILGDGQPQAAVQATSTTESVPLSSIGPVVVQRVVDNPAHFRPGDLPTEVVLTVNWGSISRIDLEPATCGDPQCEADHGLTGTISPITAPAKGTLTVNLGANTSAASITDVAVVIFS